MIITKKDISVYKNIVLILDILILISQPKKGQEKHTVKNSGVDASTEPPNHTANLWMGWLSTLTSTGCDCELQKNGNKKN